MARTTGLLATTACFALLGWSGAAAAPLSLASTDATVRSVFATSSLTFGDLEAFGSGSDLGDILVDASTMGTAIGGSYQTTVLPIYAKTLFQNAAGDVVRTIYQYLGGRFVMNITTLVNGSPVSGQFRADIGSLFVDVNETDRSMTFEYTLGKGAFDDPLAQALGVHRGTIDGTLEAATGLASESSHTDRVRRADGAADVIIYGVPEPSAAALCLLTLSGALARMRRRSAFTARR